MCIFTAAAAGTAAAVGSSAAAAGTAATAGTALAAGTAAAGTVGAGTAGIGAATVAGTSATSALTYASLAGTLISGLYGAYSQNEAGKMNAQMASENARQADAAALDATQRGAAEANKHRQNARRMIASQNAALAANGLDISSGSALTQTTDTAALGEIDARTATDNALREAYGYSVNGANYRTQGAMAKAQGRNAAAGTLLTTMGRTLSSAYSQYGNPFGAKATPQAATGNAGYFANGQYFEAGEYGNRINNMYGGRR